jgi:hypothetical protein
LAAGRRFRPHFGVGIPSIAITQLLRAAGGRTGVAAPSPPTGRDRQSASVESSERHHPALAPPERRSAHRVRCGARHPPAPSPVRAGGPPSLPVILSLRPALGDPTRPPACRCRGTVSMIRVITWRLLPMSGWQGPFRSPTASCPRAGGNR